MPVWKDARARKPVSSFMSSWRVQQKLKRRMGLFLYNFFFGSDCQFRRAATEQPDAGDCCLLCCADGVVGVCVCVVRFDSNLHFNALRFAWLGGTGASRFIMEIPSSCRHPSFSGTHNLFWKVWRGSEANWEISFDSDGEWLCTGNWMYVGKRDSLECPD
ncbi:hypothetical protein GE21DRAFT_8506 [Neurospora crassa]|uniref:Uncharacterized protein n=1 Tax=Neurospora crassa (strain ATCC 24698 / 74-OR23-1A / CBS 708.71 / DSM 1257 / FGSC 987) TaxID=367110 RepID=V5IM32_NEUCR|nr:hypothetical protein NCU17049 [Neurospora crassa OR74A]ESA42732.1 hypothetical protein NCU17049 [Neurospora crassa OR74A]KHE85795.1 hypothetical protein GE21DRAFT_8506 [Neurospora crassa]|eukprot:XP_011394860.1 hypothetical protein NCU17049 [Neurospora crassa OR74A]